jgi:PAS domain S-box-containing protein
LGETPAEQKAFSAEKNTAWLRFTVVAFNLVLYWTVLYPVGDPAVAAAVTVVASVYIVYIVALQPYRRYPILATSLWVTMTDGFLIPFWVYSTGGFDSPFYLLWFLSLFAVTFRYSWRIPLAAALVYSATYVLLLHLTGGLAPHAVDVMVRIVYLLLAGILGSLLARESLRLFEERYRLGQTVQESRRLRDLAESSPEALVIAAGGIVMEANRAYCELMGKPREQLVGQPAPSPVPAEATASQGVEAWLTRPDGERILVRAIANPLEYQEKPALFVALRDVTQEREAQEAREQTLQAEMEVKRLREVDRFKSEFINAAAHELNTPLTPLKLQLHILKKRLPKDSSLERRTVDMLDRNLERLVWLVDEMLDVARMNSGRLRLRPVESDLARLARETVETFTETARARGIELRLDCPASLPGVLDPQRITQVLFNLVSNAIKFTPHGGHVQVRARKDGAVLEATVADTGAGLTKAQADRLFQPFSRQHREQVDAPGTGLGLYISLGIVIRHAGTLTCGSAGPGKGSTFTMRLPVEGPVEAPSPPLGR